MALNSPENFSFRLEFEPLFSIVYLPPKSVFSGLKGMGQGIWAVRVVGLYGMLVAEVVISWI